MLEMLLAQVKRYPLSRPQDLVKALYQAEFGNGHFIHDAQEGLSRLKDELASLTPAGGSALVEPLGPGYARVHLGALMEHGLSPDTLMALFALSARQPAGSMEAFLSHLSLLERLVEGGILPLNPQETRAFLIDYRARGCPPQSHSEAFRQAYAPAYRVISRSLAGWLPVFSGIDSLMALKTPVTLAIEGGSASGKTSLAALLQSVYGCNVFHMDDFFLQARQRTPERYQEPGGNVDHERFLEEVLMPLQTGQPFSYRPFNCQAMDFGPAVSVSPAPLNIIEGAYSLHPNLAWAYDLSVFLLIDPRTQEARVRKRNGPVMLQRFLREWIPLEEHYFRETRAQERSDLVLQVSGQ